MKHFVYFLLIILVLFATSCATTTKSCGSDYEQIKITSQGIIQKPIVADLDVAKEKKSLTKTYETNSPSTGKELIMGDFVHEYKCDVIVHPIFNYCINSKNEQNILTITVTGYPASYKNFRNFELKDTVNFVPSQYQIFPAERGLLMSPISKMAEIKKKKPGLIAGIVLAIALVAGVLSR